MELNRISSIAVFLFLQAQYGQSADYSPSQQAEQTEALISLLTQGSGGSLLIRGFYYYYYYNIILILYYIIFILYYIFLLLGGSVRGYDYNVIPSDHDASDDGGIRSKSE